MKPFSNSRRGLAPVSLLGPIVVLSALLAFAMLQGAEQPAGKAPAQPADPGLRGILPQELPDGLYLEDFETLGANWQTWTEGMSEEIFALYDAESGTAASQRTAIAALRDRVETMEQALDDSKYRVIHAALSSVRGRILRRIDLAEAILDTLSTDPKAAHQLRLKSARSQVEYAVWKLRSMLKRVNASGPWLKYVHADELEKSAKDAKDDAPVYKSVLEKFAGRKSIADEKQREFFSRPAFLAVEAAVQELATAAKDVPKPADRAAVRAAAAEIVKAVEQTEKDNLTASATQLRHTFARFAQTLPDRGARIGDVLDLHYVNYNMHVIATESFMARLVHQERIERSGISDYVLGAAVSGWQTTRAVTGVDIKPSDDGALFDVTVTGNIQSSTAGATRRATIYTSGYHRFRASRPVHFDGDKFVFMKPSDISVAANNTTTGARTRVGWIPIIGWIANGVAVNAAERRRGQSEAIARQKIRDRVLPEFNDEMVKVFKQANEDVQTRWNDRLTKAGLTTSARWIRSDDTHLRMSSRIMGKGELGGSSVDSIPKPQSGVVLHIHESLLNNVATQMDIAGKTMTEWQTREEIRRWFDEFLGNKFVPGKRPAGDENEDKFTFHKTDPIRFQVDNGKIFLIVRTELKQEGKEDIPMQEVIIPLTYSIEGDEIVVTTGDVKVRPEGKTRGARQVIWAGVIRKKVAQSLPGRRRSRDVQLKRQDPKKSPIVVRINRIAPNNGWVTVWGE